MSTPAEGTATPVVGSTPKSLAFTSTPSTPATSRTPRPTVSTATETSNGPRTSQKNPAKVDVKELVVSDTLGKLAQEATELFERSQSFEEFVLAARGPSDLHQDVDQLDHSASELLGRYRDEGVPFQASTPSWEPDRIEEALRRGPHQSANLYKDFVREEFVDFVRKRFWVILPARLVRHLKKLRLSPLGVVPQHVNTNLRKSRGAVSRPIK